MADNAKQITDMALGAATTVAFAFGPVGAACAAALAMGKFLFDVLYPTGPNLVDPMKQAPDRADLKMALDQLADEIDDHFFHTFTTQYQDEILDMSNNLNDAIRHAGRLPSKNAHCLPGPTFVWVNDTLAPLWTPLDANPNIFGQTLLWIEGAPSHKFETAPLYALCVSLELLYLKTAIVWEINNNFKDYEIRKAKYDAALTQYNSDMLVWKANGSNPATKPVMKVTQPAMPTGGDPALGSETFDPQGNYTGAQSHLGKASSKWAIKLRDLLNDKDDKGNPTGPIAHLESVLSDYDSKLAAKNNQVEASMTAAATAHKIHVQATAPMAAAQNKASGSAIEYVPITDKGFQWLQTDLVKEAAAGNLDGVLVKSDKLDKLTAKDVENLKATAQKWRDTLAMFQKALATGDDGPLNPPDTTPPPNSTGP